MKDVLFFEESIQAIYNYFKDVPSGVVNCFFLLATADGWTTLTIFFLTSVDTPCSGFKP